MAVDGCIHEAPGLMADEQRPLDNCEANTQDEVPDAKQIGLPERDLRRGAYATCGGWTWVEGWVAQEEGHSLMEGDDVVVVERHYGWLSGDVEVVDYPDQYSPAAMSRPRGCAD